MYPAAEVPGPGSYNTQKVKEKKDFNSNGSTSVFLSKVPNCKDAQNKSQTNNLDPGHYQQAQSQKDLKAKAASNVFQSKTTKGDSWLNNPEAPFSKNQKLTNPGPGKYGEKKKKEDLKKKILNEDVIKVPFGTGDVRSFNKKKAEDT